MRRKNSWCVGIVSVLVFTLVVVSCISVSALRINEINPQGKEYVEIYNDLGEINLDEWFIKDPSDNEPDKITCQDIPDCSLITNAEYFMIIGRSTNIREITAEEIIYFFADDQKIGNGLNDGGDEITFYKSGFESWYKYDNSEADKSWQFCNSGWILDTPSPGKKNNCQETIQQNEENEYENKTKDETVEKKSYHESSETIYVTQNKTNEQDSGTRSTEDNETEMIYINQPGSTILYESKTENIKKLSILLLGLLGAVAAVILLKWKMR